MIEIEQLNNPVIITSAFFVILLLALWLPVISTRYLLTAVFAYLVSHTIAYSLLRYFPDYQLLLTRVMQSVVFILMWCFFVKIATVMKSVTINFQLLKVIFILNLMVALGILIGILNDHPVKWVFSDGVRYIQIIAGYSFAVLFFSAASFQKVMLVVMLISLVPALVNIAIGVQYITFGEIRFAAGDISGVIFIPWILGQLIALPKATNKCYFVLLAIFATSLLVTMTRTYWLAVIIAILPLAGVSLLIKKQLKLLAYLLIALLAVYVLDLFTKGQFFDSMVIRLQDVFEDLSWKFRLEESINLIQSWIDSPTLGKGLGATFPVGKLFAEMHGLDPNLQLRYPHFGFLEILLYFGMVGLAIYAWIVLRTVFMCVKIASRNTDENERALALGLLGIVIAISIVSPFAIGLGLFTGFIYGAAQKLYFDYKRKKLLVKLKTSRHDNAS